MATMTQMGAALRRALPHCARSARRHAPHCAAAPPAARPRLLSAPARPPAAAPEIRNVAIVAHVDHGKTTLVDRLLAQCELTGASGELDERAMDSDAQERERGITIMSKVTSILWRGTRLNIVDTPGHADFGGEVERVLGMVDAVCLLVDASEGVMAQTKFVLRKAIAAQLRPLVVLNKVDRDSARIDETVNDIFDTMVALGASDAQLDFPILYASGKEGWATEEPPGAEGWGARHAGRMAPLLDRLLAHVPPPDADPAAPFAMVVTMMGHDPYLGRLLTGRIGAGTVRVGERVRALRPADAGAGAGGGEGGGAVVEDGRVVSLFVRHALQQVAAESAAAGEIVTLAGLGDATVGHTVCAPAVERALPAPAIDPPTVRMTVLPNSGPLSGKDPASRHLTSQKLKERILTEAQSNVSIVHEPCATDPEGIDVLGRGAMQLGVLVENLRREGYEMCISPPKVVTREGEGGRKLEPYEDVFIEVDDEHVGGVIDALTAQKGEVRAMDAALGRTQLSMVVPARAMLSFRGRFHVDTRGTGVLTTAFREYGPWAGPLGAARKGALVSTADGTTTGYALSSIEARGTLFVEPAAPTYCGMIIGEHTQEADLDVNPTKAKHLTNMRSVVAEEAVRLSPPRTFQLEEAIAYVASDELLEVTPGATRMRKAELDANKRKAMARKSGGRR